MKRTGSADISLHGGRVPSLAATRMTELGIAIAERVILNYGLSYFVCEGSHPERRSHALICGSDSNRGGLSGQRGGATSISTLSRLQSPTVIWTEANCLVSRVYRLARAESSPNAAWVTLAEVDSDKAEDRFRSGMDARLGFHLVNFDLCGN